MADTPLERETFEAKEVADKELFDNTFNASLEQEHMVSDDMPDQEKRALMMFSQFITPMSTELNKLWQEAKGNRKSTERRMLKDLRQYRGVYDQEILNKMHPKRSKAFVRYTRSKVRAVDSRIMDLMFPSNGEKNWSVTVSPVPQLPPNEMELLARQYFETLEKVPTDDDMRRVVMHAARERAENMEKEIEDQLNAFKYRDTIRKVVHSGHVFGTGILKGPLVKEKVRKHWMKNEDGKWQLVSMKNLIPHAQWVSVWDAFPDLSAKDPDTMSYFFERHVMNKGKLLKLSKRSDFNREAILSYTAAHPEGEAMHHDWEEDLRLMSSNTQAKYPESSIPKFKKYELAEYWGLMSKETVEEETGLKLRAEDGYDDPEVMVNAWLLGPMLIKLVISPITGSKFPYFFYYFDKDETHIFGDGIPAVMRDPQALLNASVRAMVDNAAISAGPIIEANIDLLADGEDPNDIYPFRSFQRTGIGTDGSAQAIRVSKIPSYTAQFMSMVEFFQAAGDESTNIPRAMHGNLNDGAGNIGGAGRTATGLSMLMGSANITLKDQLKNFDDGITKPFIKALYYWNMEYSEKEDIKGDFEVTARGSSSLVAKEVRLESLNQFLQIVGANPQAMATLDLRNLLNQYLSILDLDDLSLLKSEDQLKLEAEAMQAQASRDREFDQNLALMKAKSGGHMGNEGAGVIVNPDGSPARHGFNQEELSQGQIPEMQ